MTETTAVTVAETLPTETVLAAIRDEAERRDWCSTAEYETQQLLRITLKPYDETATKYCCQSCTGMSRKEWVENVANRPVRFTPEENTPETLPSGRVIRALRVLARDGRADAADCIGKGIFGDSWTGTPVEWSIEPTVRISGTSAVRPTVEQFKTALLALVDNPEWLARQVSTAQPR